jgi:hypothetical protein
MRYTEIIAICFGNPAKHANTLCGGSSEIVMMNAVVHTLATLLQQVNKQFLLKSPFLYYDAPAPPPPPSRPRPPHYRGFLIKLRHTPVGRTPLDEWSALCRNLLSDNTQHTQQTDLHVPGGIPTHNLSRRAAADPLLRPRGQWNRQKRHYGVLFMT